MKASIHLKKTLTKDSINPLAYILASNSNTYEITEIILNEIKSYSSGIN